MLRSLRNWWKGSPAVRFAVRTAVATIGGAVAGAYIAGDISDWDTLKGAIIAGGIKLFVGYFTPEEPFVGTGKPTNVQVPVPPAVRET